MAGIRLWMTKRTFIRLRSGRLQRARLRPLQGEDPKRDRRHPNTPTPPPNLLSHAPLQNPPPGGLTPFGPYPPAFQLQPAPVTTHPLETLTLRPTPRPTPPSEATGWANPLSTTPPSHLTHEPLTPHQTARRSDISKDLDGSLPSGSIATSAQDLRTKSICTKSIVHGGAAPTITGTTSDPACHGCLK